MGSIASSLQKNYSNEQSLFGFFIVKIPAQETISKNWSKKLKDMVHMARASLEWAEGSNILRR